nr:hypothetical protein CTI12_AA123990 [Tanacetum cinerariifolium]
VDLYHNLCDAVTRGDTSAVRLGKRIVLTRTYVGSPSVVLVDYCIPNRKAVSKIIYDESRYFRYSRGDTSAVRLGKRIVLTRTYVGSPRGAQSFTDLNMVNKTNYDTFKAACFAYGMLNDDKE